jgi:TonB family protein
VEHQEMDCAGARFRGRRHWSFGATSVPQPADDEAAGPGWRPVAEDDLPLFQLICGYLLGSFATSLPLTVESSTADREPELVNRMEIAQLLARAYPSALRDAGTPGAVTIRMQITAEGRVDLATFRPLWATRPQFAEAARGVVARMRFRPALLHGRPTAVWITLPLSFDVWDDASRPAEQPGPPPPSRGSALPHARPR